jgi:hypothetical protein
MAILVSHWRHIGAHRCTSFTTKLSDLGVPSVYYTDVPGVYAYIHHCTIYVPAHAYETREHRMLTSHPQLH